LRFAVVSYRLRSLNMGGTVGVESRHDVQQQKKEKHEKKQPFEEAHH